MDPMHAKKRKGATLENVRKPSKFSAARLRRPRVSDFIPVRRTVAAAAAWDQPRSGLVSAAPRRDHHGLTPTVETSIERIPTGQGQSCVLPPGHLTNSALGAAGAARISVA